MNEQRAQNKLIFSLGCLYLKMQHSESCSSSSSQSHKLAWLLMFILLTSWASNKPNSLDHKKETATEQDSSTREKTVPSLKPDHLNTSEVNVWSGFTVMCWRKLLGLSKKGVHVLLVHLSDQLQSKSLKCSTEEQMCLKDPQNLVLIRIGPPQACAMAQLSYCRTALLQWSICNGRAEHASKALPA